MLCELGLTVPDGVAITDDGGLIIPCYRPDVIYRWHIDDGLTVIAADPPGHDARGTDERGVRR